MILTDIKTQQYSLGSIFSLAWSIYRKNFVSILLVTLIVSIPLNIAGELITEPFINNILTSIFKVFGAIAVVFITERAIMKDETISFGDALRLASGRWGSGIITNILFGIIVGLLSLLLIVPGIIWLIYYTFAIQVVALRNFSGKTALDYSKGLVKGQWWRVFGVAFTAIIMLIIAYFAIEFAFALTLGVSPVISVICITIEDIAAAFYTVAITALFLNIDYQKGLSNVGLEVDSYRGD